MTKKEFHHILKEIKPYTKTIYLHVKGEPLLHKELSSFLDIASEEGFRVNITTNGVLLPKTIEMLKEKPSLSKINVSLHCEQNRTNYFEEVFKAVSYLPDSTTVIYRMWTLQGGKIDEKSTRIVEELKRFYKLSPTIVEKIYQDKQVQLRGNIFVDKENLFEWPSEATSKEKEGFCYALKTQIAILSDGTVVPCCLDAEGDISLGNIFETSLEAIITSPSYQALQKSFQDRKPDNFLCQRCSFKERFQK